MAEGSIGRSGEANSRLRLAVLDAQLAAQVAERRGELEGIEVVWSGTDLVRFLDEVPRVGAEVVAVELSLLGEDPTARVRSLAEETGAEMVVVLYAFAKRELVRALSEGDVRASTKTLRSPVSLESLRGLMSGLLVRKILNPEGREPRVPANERRAPPPTTKPLARPAGLELPKYSVAQLGRIKEIESGIECECPAHVADLLSQLAAFEAYSAQCANRDEADRRIHQMLHDETRRARVVMEKALEQLLVHEGIEI